MDYLDLFCSQSAAEKEQSLGFKRVFCPPVLTASPKSASQFQTARSQVIVLEANDALGMANVLGRVPVDKVTLVTPFSSSGFFREDALYAAMGAQVKAGKAVAFHLPLSGLMRQSFVYRARYLRHLRIFLKKASKFNAPVILTGGAQSPWEAKSPQEHLAVATTLYGLTLPQAQTAISYLPQKLLKETLGDRG
jgi:hypothetical protein